MNKRDLIIYRVVTGLFTLLTLMGVGMYLFQHDVAVEAYTKLGYPTYLIYPLAFAKLAGLITIWANVKTLKEWAYAGFVFDFILGIGAHVMINDGEHFGAVIALILVSISYIYNRKVYHLAKN